MRARILQRDGGCCQVCGAPATDIDHIVPITRGGSDDDDNLVSLCKLHHEAKSKGERRRVGQKFGASNAGSGSPCDAVLYRI